MVLALGNPANRRDTEAVLSRRAVLLGLAGITASAKVAQPMVASAAVVPPSGLRKNRQPSPLTIRRPRFLVTDLTTRTYGSVLFLSDSTSAKLCERMAKRLTGLGVGPFCIDINLGRLIARDRGYSPSAITSVRQARNAGFDAESYVIALGFSDILNNMQDPRFVGDPVPTVVSILESLLNEIGRDRTVGILNLHGATTFSGARAVLFNEGLSQVANDWPNVHIIDWASVAAPHRAWHMLDGIHYRWRGSSERHRFVSTAIRDTAKLHLESPPPPTSTSTSTSTTVAVSSTTA